MLFTNSGVINNLGIMNVNSNITSTTNIQTSNRLNLSANILMSAATTLSNTGDIYVSGSRSLSNGGLTSSGGTIHLSITDATVHDAIGTSGAVDVSGATINVSSSFSQAGEHSWELLRCSSITSSGSTNVVLPSSSGLFSRWSSSFSATSLIVALQNNLFTDLADTGINKEVAIVLDNMSNNITNSGQQKLINIFQSMTTEEDFNDALHKMIPNQNYNQQSIQLQNAVFSRVESRLAGLNSNFAIRDFGPDYAAGDIYADTALWIGGFGSSTRQRQRGQNEGYKSGAAGFLMGIDHINHADNIFGIALGNSNSSINDSSNSSFTTKIIGYHFLAYASCNLHYNKFYEFLLTSSVNNNNGTRNILISGNNFTTIASYHNYQLGGRINYGKHCDLTSELSLSPVAMLQYSLLNKPTYQEAGSVAALEVEQRGSKNILTIGAGARLSFNEDNWWSIGSREVRAMITYDAVSPNQSIASRFLVGSEDFILTSSPARTALRLGVDFGFQVLSCVTLQLTYDYEVRSGFTDHTGMLKFKYLF